MKEKPKLLEALGALRPSHLGEGREVLGYHDYWEGYDEDYIGPRHVASGEFAVEEEYLVTGKFHRNMSHPIALGEMGPGDLVPHEDATVDVEYVPYEPVAFTVKNILRVTTWMTIKWASGFFDPTHRACGAHVHLSPEDLDLFYHEWRKIEESQGGIPKYYSRLFFGRDGESHGYGKKGDNAIRRKSPSVYEIRLMKFSHPLQFLRGLLLLLALRDGKTLGKATMWALQMSDYLRWHLDVPDIVGGHEISSQYHETFTLVLVPSLLPTDGRIIAASPGFRDIFEVPNFRRLPAHFLTYFNVSSPTLFVVGDKYLRWFWYKIWDNPEVAIAAVEAHGGMSYVNT